MNENRAGKKRADGIRVKKTGARPDAILSPTAEEAEEIVIHAYSPSAPAGEPEPHVFFEGADEPILSEPVIAPRRVPAAGRHAMQGMIAGLVLVAGIGLAGSTIFAAATVRVKPKIEAVTIQDVSVVLDASASQPAFEQKIIPAEHVHFVQTSEREVAASATRYSEAKARGTVKISNQYSAAPQRLISQTRFITPSGAIFRLAGAVVVPGAVSQKGTLAPGSVQADLVADAAGEQANLSGPVQLKIVGFQGTPKYDAFTAVAQNGFSGGARGMQKIASDADLQAGEQAASKQAYDDLKNQMQQKIPPGLRMIDALQAIRIVKVGPAADTGSQGTLAVQAVAEGDALLFHEDDVISLLKGALLPQDNSKSFVDGSINLTYAVRTLNFDQGRADVSIQGSAKAKTPLTAGQAAALAAALSGKKEGSVREFFNGRTDVVLSSLSIFPSWKSTLPSNPGRITIVEDE